MNVALYMTKMRHTNKQLYEVTISMKISDTFVFYCNILFSLTVQLSNQKSNELLHTVSQVTILVGTYTTYKMVFCNAANMAYLTNLHIMMSLRYRRHVKEVQ